MRGRWVSKFMADADLMSLLRFSPDDLESNREGRLSEMQQYYLRVRRQRAILIGLGGILVTAFVATLFIFLGQQDDSLILNVIGVGITVCGAAITGVFARYWMRLSADIHRGEIAVVRGEIERVLKPINKQIITYILRIGRVEVAVSKETFKAFEHGKSYILYRTPHSGLLLAAEPMVE